MDGTKLDNKEKCRQYYQKNKLAIIARVKKYYYAHRCAIAQQRRHYYERKKREAQLSPQSPT
jgi:hypothetical protein